MIEIIEIKQSMLKVTEIAYSIACTFISNISLMAFNPPPDIVQFNHSYMHKFPLSTLIMRCLITIIYQSVFKITSI
jgi:hypothetical protein